MITLLAILVGPIDPQVPHELDGGTLVVTPWDDGAYAEYLGAGQVQFYGEMQLEWDFSGPTDVSLQADFELADGEEWVLWGTDQGALVFIDNIHTPGLTSYSAQHTVDYLSVDWYPQAPGGHSSPLALSAASAVPEPSQVLMLLLVLLLAPLVGWLWKKALKAS